MSRPAIAQGCQMAVDAFRKAMASNEQAKECLANVKGAPPEGPASPRRP